MSCIPHCLAFHSWSRSQDALAYLALLQCTELLNAVDGVLGLSMWLRFMTAWYAAPWRKVASPCATFRSDQIGMAWKGNSGDGEQSCHRPV